MYFSYHIITGNADVSYSQPFLTFFDINMMNGVKELKREQDAVSDPILIPFGLFFGNKKLDTAYVSTCI